MAAKAKKKGFRSGLDGSAMMHEFFRSPLNSGYGVGVGMGGTPAGSYMSQYYSNYGNFAASATGQNLMANPINQLASVAASGASGASAFNSGAFFGGHTATPSA